MEEQKITRVNQSSHKSISTHSGITLKKHPVQLCFCTDTSTVILLLPPSWQRVVKPIQTKMSEEFEVGGRKWLLMVILFICRCANGLYGNILDPGQNMKGIADLIWLASEALSGHDAMTHKYTSQFILVQKEKKNSLRLLWVLHLDCFQRTYFLSGIYSEKIGISHTLQPERCSLSPSPHLH